MNKILMTVLIAIGIAGIAASVALVGYSLWQYDYCRNSAGVMYSYDVLTEKNVTEYVEFDHFKKDGEPCTLHTAVWAKNGSSLVFAYSKFLREAPYNAKVTYDDYNNDGLKEFIITASYFDMGKRPDGYFERNYHLPWYNMTMDAMLTTEQSLEKGPIIPPSQSSIDVLRMDKLANNTQVIRTWNDVEVLSQEIG